MTPITSKSLCFDQHGKRREFLLDDMNGVPHVDIATLEGKYGDFTNGYCGDLDKVTSKGFMFAEREEFATVEAELPIMDGTYSGAAGLGDAISGLALTMLSYPGDTFRVTVVRS